MQPPDSYGLEPHFAVSLCFQYSYISPGVIPGYCCDQQQDAAEFLIGVIGEINDLFTSQRLASKVMDSVPFLSRFVLGAERAEYATACYVHRALR